METAFQLILLEYSELQAKSERGSSHPQSRASGVHESVKAVNPITELNINDGQLIASHRGATTINQKPLPMTPAFNSPERHDTMRRKVSQLKMPIDTAR